MNCVVADVPLVPVLLLLVVVVVGATRRCSGWFVGEGVGRVCAAGDSALRISPVRVVLTGLSL